MKESKHIPKSRILVFRILTLLFGLVIAFIVGEVFLRIFPKFVADPPAPPPYNYREPIKQYGWLVKEGYQFDGEMKDFKGNPYPLHLSFGKNGFRMYGDPQTTAKKKVFFIGDSYTACAQTSDDKTWYKLLQDSLPIEAFVFGAAGYSNAQEYLVLEKYIHDIKPDLVVLETCSNDFIDNYWALERAANYKVRMPRPYVMENGSITYASGAEYPRSVKSTSHLLYFILSKWAKSKGTFDKPPAEPAEKLIAEQNDKYPLFAQSLRMTETVFNKMKQTLPPDCRFLAFCADGFEPQYSHFKSIAEHQGIPFAHGLPQFVDQAEHAGQVVRTDDGYHWNNRGNELVAAFLKPILIRELQLPVTTSAPAGQ